jgi:NDP-sugar pyrophosphorylase family protein
MKAVIMAGGLGQRLKPLTKVIPKPLLPVGESSVLEILVTQLRDCGFKDLFVALNYQSSLFEAFLNSEKWNMNIVCSKEEIPLGTAGPIKLFKEQLTEPFLVINGDILTNLDFRRLREFHDQQNVWMSVVTKAITIPLRYGIIQSAGDKIVSIQEKPDVSADIIAGIYFCDPRIMECIPDNKFFTMIDLLHTLLNEKKPMARFHLHDYWLDIGNMEDYEKAQDLYSEGVFTMDNQKEKP